MWTNDNRGRYDRSGLRRCFTKDSESHLETEIDNSRDVSEPAPIAAGSPSRVARRRQTGPSLCANSPGNTPFPRARLSGSAGDDRSAMFFAGAGIETSPSGGLHRLSARRVA